MNLYQTALKIAIKAHEGQMRKHDGSAYVVHPIMVARILDKAGFDEVTVAAALVHDVLEDTTVTEDELRAALGDDVVSIVTAVSEDTALLWEERKETYVQSVIAGGESVWAVSVADKIHNASDLLQHHEMIGSDVWSVFNRGKEKKIWFERLLHGELSKVWQHPLLLVYEKKIRAMEELVD